SLSPCAMRPTRTSSEVSLSIRRRRPAAMAAIASEYCMADPRLSLRTLFACRMLAHVAAGGFARVASGGGMVSCRQRIVSRAEVIRNIWQAIAVIIFPDLSHSSPGLRHFFSRKCRMAAGDGQFYDAAVLAAPRGRRRGG